MINKNLVMLFKRNVLLPSDDIIFYCIQQINIVLHSQVSTKGITSTYKKTLYIRLYDISKYILFHICSLNIQGLFAEKTIRQRIFFLFFSSPLHVFSIFCSFYIIKEKKKTQINNGEI